MTGQKVTPPPETKGRERSSSHNLTLSRKMRASDRLPIAAVIAVCGVALLSQVARPSPGPIETEDIFASLEKPVAPRSHLPRARDFTTRSFTRPGMGNDSLVQKRHRLEAEKKLLEEKKQSLIDELQGKRDRAVVRTWRGAIQAHRERLDRSIDYAQRKLRESREATVGQRGRQEDRYLRRKAERLDEEAMRRERVKELEGLLKGYIAGHPKDAAAEQRANTVLRSLGTLEEGVEDLENVRQRAALTADVLRVEKAVLG